MHWAEHPIAIAPDHDFDGSIIDTGAIFQAAAPRSPLAPRPSLSIPRHPFFDGTSSPCNAFLVSFIPPLYPPPSLVITQHPNGTVLAIYATSNVTSNLPSGTFDGDICLAVSEDAGLLTWRKICKQPDAGVGHARQGGGRGANWRRYWSRALSNSAVACRVLWNQLPEFVKDYSRWKALP